MGVGENKTLAQSVERIEVPWLYTQHPDGVIRRDFVSYDQLRRFAARVPYRGGGAVLRAYSLSLSLLGAFFGQEWLDRNLLASAPSPDFLRRNPESLDDAHAHFSRVIFLAEGIFNLQRVSGLENVLDQLRANDLESAYAELDVGKVLSVYGLAFRFVKPQKVRTKDYDVELFHHNGQLCCADTKCKAETTDSRGETIMRTLKHGRGQLPKDKPGIILMKVPQRWIESPDFEPQF
jgi:hypothetical protein